MKKNYLTLLIVLITITSKAQWSAVGGANALFSNYYITTICTDAAGNIYAGGNFTNASGNEYVAKWTKTTNTWSELGGNNSLKANGTIYSVLLDKSGNLYAAGSFYNGTGYYVAKWDGTSWTEVGGNFGGGNGSIGTLCLDASGNLYAGGSLTDGTGKYGIVKWDGSSWTELGGTTLAANGSINTICTDPSGNVYAAGAFTNGSKWYVAKWNGSNWSEVGGINALAANGGINTICSDKFGNIYAGGNFNVPLKGEYVAKWDGNNWSHVEGTDSIILTSGINSMITDNSGNLYIAALCGTGSTGSFVGMWNGTNWIQLNMQSFPYTINGEPETIAFDSTGNLFIGGTFHDPNTFNSFVAEYSGSTTPVKLVSFNAIKQNNNVVLQWSTAQEENSKYFTIQRSEDGKNFVNIAEVPAAGNSSIDRNYSYADENINSLQNNIIFYRVSETDANGTVTYTSIKAINLVSGNSIFSVYPNPVKNILSIENKLKGERLTITISDLSGRKIVQQTIPNKQLLTMQTNNLTSGVYLISISDGATVMNKKIIKE